MSEAFALSALPRPPWPADIVATMPRLADAKIFAMAFIGGIIRLTESGLSITEWKPISAVILNWRGGFTRAKRRPLVTQIVPSPYVPPSPWKDDPPALRCCPRILPWPFDANCRPAQVACWLNSGASHSPKVPCQRADELVPAVHIPRRLEFATSTPSARRQLSCRAHGFPRSSPARTPDVSPARGTPRSPAAQSRGKHPSMILLAMC